jgi:hypothetical protein
VEFYSAMAQVLPVLLLAIVWESKFLEKLKTERRPARKPDGSRGWFWTKPKVRAYSWFVTGAIVTAVGATALVLSELVPDSFLLRLAILAALALTLGTMLTRLWVDVFNATRKLDGE